MTETGIDVEKPHNLNEKVSTSDLGENIGPNPMPQRGLPSFREIISYFAISTLSIPALLKKILVETTNYIIHDVDNHYIGQFNK